MLFNQSDDIRYLTFDSLREAGLRHAAFTRHGGISPQPWASLNFGGTVGDATERVRSNRFKALKTLDQPPENMFEVWQ